LNASFLISLLPGVLQLVVAGLALRLIRNLGAVGTVWLLLSAFISLALVQLALSRNEFPAGADRAVFVNAAYAFVTLLLFAWLFFLESGLKARLLAERAAARKEAQAASEVQLAEHTEKITRANEELTMSNNDLKRAASRLESEVAERIRTQKQLEKTHQEMMTVSRQAGMSEVATGVLHNVGNVLNSVNVSATLVADRLAEFNLTNLAQAAKMLRDHSKDLGQFLTTDPKGKQLPEYLSQLASHLSSEQHSLIKEIGFVKSRIDHIKEIVATQQRYGRVVGLAEKVRLPDLVEDVLRIHASELAQKQVQIHREYEPGLPEILLDKHKALQILINLLSNAKHSCIESGHKERQVTISITNGDDRLRVAVSDNGVGIPTGNLKQIFNHGFTTRKNGGHGFGLHSGALAAKEMGGALTAASDGPGMGATFTLEIPFKRPSNGPKI